MRATVRTTQAAGAGTASPSRTRRVGRSRAGRPRSGPSRRPAASAHAPSASSRASSARSTTAHGRPCRFAAWTVSSVPPVGSPTVRISVKSESRTFQRVWVAWSLRRVRAILPAILRHRAAGTARWPSARRRLNSRRQPGVAELGNTPPLRTGRRCEAVGVVAGQVGRDDAKDGPPADAAGQGRNSPASHAPKARPSRRRRQASHRQGRPPPRRSGKRPGRNGEIISPFRWRRPAGWRQRNRVVDSFAPHRPSIRSK